MISNSSRPSWDRYALDLAITAATRSQDIVKVGAAALDFDNYTLGTAYNGLAPKKKVPAEFWLDRDARRPFMIHAETNMLAQFERGRCKTLACTLLPCTACATNIVAHGIQRVVYKDTYKRDTNAFDIFKFYNVELIKLD